MKRVPEKNGGASDTVLSGNHSRENICPSGQMPWVVRKDRSTKEVIDESLQKIYNVQLVILSARARYSLIGLSINQPQGDISKMTATLANHQALSKITGKNHTVPHSISSLESDLPFWAAGFSGTGEN